MEAKNPTRYNHEKFGIVLVLDGIEKIDEEVLDKLIDYRIVDPEACSDTLLRTDKETGDFVKRSFNKKETKLSKFVDGEDVKEENPGNQKYHYATNNVAHIFSKKLDNDVLETMLNL